jgi:hypothetical protein
MKHLSGWALTILLVLILPGVAVVSVELLQRHRYADKVARLDASLRTMESDVQLVCVDSKNRQLEVGLSPTPIRLVRSVQTYDNSPYRSCTWNLIATCGSHGSGHGLRMEFAVSQERRTFLRSPQVTMHHNIPIPQSLEPDLQRALQGLDVDRYYFEY